MSKRQRHEDDEAALKSAPVRELPDHAVPLKNQDTLWGTLNNALRASWFLTQEQWEGMNTQVVAFSDWTTCDQHPRRVVESQPLYQATRLYKSCGLCPEDAHAVGQFELDPDADMLADVNAARVAWQAAHRASSNPTPEQRIAERAAWLRYFLVVYDRVRRPVVLNYLREGPLGKMNDAAQLAQMKVFVLDFSIMRHVGKKQAQWCCTHNQVGHMFPVLGRQGYDSQCYICPLPRPQSIKKDLLGPEPTQAAAEAAIAAQVEFKESQMDD